MRTENAASGDRITSRQDRGPCPLSFAQERIWFWDQLEPQTSLYNVPIGFRIRGRLDVIVLEKSLNLLVARHEALRTRFFSDRGVPVQAVADHRSVELSVTDLRHRKGPERETEARRTSTAFALRPFDLSSGKLLRAGLIRLDDDDCILLLVAHHIAVDMWSLVVLSRELTEAYSAYSRGNTPGLPDLPIQYSDFSVWQRQRLQGGSLETLLSFWKQQVAGYPESYPLIPDHPRPSRWTYRGARTDITLEEDLTSSLTRLSRKHGVTLFMTLMAAFQVLVQRYSGHDDIVIGFPIAHRSRPEISDLIGFFVNTLILRSDLSDNPKFSDLLSRVRTRALGAYLHQDLPFEKIVEILQPDRTLNQAPLLQAMFVFQNVPTPVPEWPGLCVTPFQVDTGVAKFDLTMFVEPRGGGFRAALEYNTDLFERVTINRLLGHYRRLLEAAVASPESRIENFPLLSERERAQVLTEWNDTERPFPQATVHELFEAQAIRTPDSIALVSEGQQWTYKELNRRANRVARYLREQGVGKKTRVGVCLDRSPELIMALLGILKAGGAYVPLNPDDPSERQAFMLADSEARVLLTQHPLTSPPMAGVKVIPIAELSGLKIGAEDENCHSSVTADHPAYVMYTSGSTGRPKGVEILHRGIVRLVFSQDYTPMTEREVFLHLAPTSFDASTFEIWAPLLHGAKCVLYKGKVPSANELGAVLRKHKVTTLWLTSTLFNTLVDEDPHCLAPVRHLLVGGEALSLPHIRRVLQALREIELTNGYGPTECTTFSCTYSIPRSLPANLTSIPIGKPIANTKVYVLDRHLQPVPVGVPGELHIGGPGLASGYINQPELTAEKFIANPFDPATGERLYKTGDLVRSLPDGTLEFLGRRDQQVKIRGHRIELGEIEAALSNHPSLQSAAVVLHEKESTGKYLVAYTVARNGNRPDVHELSRFMSAKVPGYMVPQEWVILDALPRLASGKVDRRALRSLAHDDSGRREDFIAPRNSVESQLASIWEDILDKRPIGVRDNFFDVGGHSLLAVRVVAAIERAFGKKLDLSSLLAAPTIERLASLVNSATKSRDSCLVPVQPKGDKHPLFCVHGGGGHVLRFRDLARELGPEQPFYGLRSPEFDGKSGDVTVERLAEVYLPEIRSMQQKGPYYLAGASFGGLVAYEMASRLDAQGEEVALLALFDTANPAILKRLPSSQSLRFRAHYRLRGSGDDRNGSWPKAARNGVRLSLLLFQAIQSRLSFLVWWAAYRTCRLIHRRLPHALRDNLKLFTLAARRYQPKPSDVRLSLFKAAEQNALLGPDPELGWGAVAGGGVEIYVVPGDHMTILDKPRVAKLAERLRVLLDVTEKEQVNQNGALHSARV